MKIAGKIIVRPMGLYSATFTYGVLDMVTLDNILYMAKKDGLIGVTPSATTSDSWVKLIDGGMEQADIEEFMAEVEQRFGAIETTVTQNKSDADSKHQSLLDAIETLVTEIARELDSVTNALGTRIETAQTAADDAQTAADAAQLTADGAKTDAATAQSTADGAQTAAEAAQSTANTAKTNAATAQTAADNAQTRADLGVENARIAHSLADSAKAKAETNATNLATHITEMDTELAELQKQIDGAISTHFFAYVPTASNKPASDWTTNEIKNVHLGDLFYNTATGYCYRYQLQNGTYSWSILTDSDVTKALADAAAALTRANAAEARVEELETAINGLNFEINLDTGNLEWGLG